MIPFKIFHAGMFVPGFVDVVTRGVPFGKGTPLSGAKPRRF
jgi:hypothetical protein